MVGTRPGIEDWSLVRGESWKYRLSSPSAGIISHVSSACTAQNHVHGVQPPRNAFRSHHSFHLIAPLFWRRVWPLDDGRWELPADLLGCKVSTLIFIKRRRGYHQNPGCWSHRMDFGLVMQIHSTETTTSEICNYQLVHTETQEILAA